MKQKNTHCPLCGKELGFFSRNHTKHEGQNLCTKCALKTMREKQTQSTKQIQETKCTCQACGNVWFYGKQDVTENRLNSMNNLGNDMLCCSGCTPAAVLPDKKVTVLDRCPKCNSRAVTKETVIHNV